jgi:hypothetical protein
MATSKNGASKPLITAVQYRAGTGPISVKSITTAASRSKNHKAKRTGLLKRDRDLAASPEIQRKRMRANPVSVGIASSPTPMMPTVHKVAAILSASGSSADAASRAVPIAV